jgi:hypothetical protein
MFASGIVRSTATRASIRLAYCFHLESGIEHDSLRGNRKGVVGRLLRVTFDAAAVYHYARFAVANGPLSLPGVT